MKKIFIVTILILGLLATGCSENSTENYGDNNMNGGKVSAEEAKAMLEENPEIFILDVRSLEEYKEEHIPGAILLPLDDIEEKSIELIPEKRAKYLVYCRSGNRSAVATKKLVEMGYENVLDFGGIIDWPYEKISEK